VLEWDPIDLATAELRSLSLYRNGNKAGAIPKDKLSTKISGLALDTEYTFHLVLRTSAGQYSSERLTIKTHTMDNLSGITVSAGVMPNQLKDSLAETVNRIGAKFIDSVRIDTTHFVCTEPRGQAWEKAVEMNVPVVVPDWVKGCEREGRIVGVRGYYLDADPKLRQMGTSTIQRSSVSNAPTRESPRIEHTPPTPERPTRSERTFTDDGSSDRPPPPPKPSNEPFPQRDVSSIREESNSNQPPQSGFGPPLAHRPQQEGQYSDDEEYDSGNESDDTAKAIEQGREEAEARPSESKPEKQKTAEDEPSKDATEDDKEDDKEDEKEDDKEDDKEEDEEEDGREGGKGEFDEVAL
jgi:hypothetical protein